MNIIRLSILSLTLAMAVMTLGYVTPLQAQSSICEQGAFCDRDLDGFPRDHQKCDMCTGQRDCDPSTSSETNVCTGTDDDFQTSFDVDMTVGYLDATNSNALVTVACEGTSGGPNLGVTFSTDSCPVVLDNSGEYCLLGISMQNNNVRALLFFTDQCGSIHAPNESVWESSRLAGAVESGPTGSSFQINLGEPDVFLIKTHQPDKRTMLSRKIIVGNIVYTATTL